MPSNYPTARWNLEIPKNIAIWTIAHRWPLISLCSFLFWYELLPQTIQFLLFLCQFRNLSEEFQVLNHPNRKHIGNIDDSLKLSSITPMMHQFYIAHRKHWWTFDVTSITHPFFWCFSTLKPAMFHLLNINDSSMFIPKFGNQTSMIHESLMKHRCFEILYFVISDDLCFHRKHECFLKESSTNHQWNIIVSGIST